MIAITANDVPTVHAFESTKFPRGDSACIAVENCCRKLARLAVSVLPPRSDTSVSKLFCNELLAVDALLDVEAVELESIVPLVLDALVRLLIRLLMSTCMREAGSLALAVEAPAPSALLESDCDCKAAIKFCMNSLNADATSLAEAVLDVERVELLEPVLSVFELDVPVAPIDDSALKIALTNPPPGGVGGGADRLLVLLSESDVSSVDKIDDRADNGIDSPEPLTALMLITIYSCDDDKDDAPQLR